MAQLSQNEIDALADRAVIISKLNITEFLTKIKNAFKALKDTING